MMKVLVVHQRFKAPLELTKGDTAFIVRARFLAEDVDLTSADFLFLHLNNKEKPFAQLKERADWATIQTQAVALTAAATLTDEARNWQRQGLPVLLDIDTLDDLLELRWDQVPSAFTGDAAALLERLHPPTRDRLRTLLFLAQGALVAADLIRHLPDTDRGIFTAGMAGADRVPDGTYEQMGWSAAARAEGGQKLCEWARARPEELLTICRDLTTSAGWRRALGLPDGADKSEDSQGGLKLWRHKTQWECENQVCSGTLLPMILAVGDWLNGGSQPFTLEDMANLYHELRPLWARGDSRGV